MTRIAEPDIKVYLNCDIYKDFNKYFNFLSITSHKSLFFCLKLKNELFYFNKFQCKPLKTCFSLYKQDFYPKITVEYEKPKLQPKTT